MLPICLSLMSGPTSCFAAWKPSLTPVYTQNDVQALTLQCRDMLPPASSPNSLAISSRFRVVIYAVAIPKYVCTYVHIQTHRHTYIHTCVCMCMHMHICLCIHQYTFFRNWMKIFTDANLEKCHSVLLITFIATFAVVFLPLTSVPLCISIK